MLGLDDSDMLATAVSAIVTAQGAEIRVEGDGLFALVFTGENPVYTVIRWDDNAPAYPWYAKDGFVSFLAHHGGDTSYACEQTSDNMWQAATKRIKTVDAMRGVTITVPSEHMARLRWIAVFSDGACQVDGFHWQEVVRDLLNFRSLTGEFAKRRMIRFVQERCKTGKGPLDDLAYAVIRIEHEESDGQSDHS